MGGDPPHVLPGLHGVAHFLVALVAENGTADGGHVEIGDVEIEIDGFGRLFCDLVPAGDGAVLEQGFGFGFGQAQVADGAFLDELVEAFALEQIEFGGRWRTGVHALRKAEFGACHGQPGGEHRLVENAYRGGRLGDAVEYHASFIVAGQGAVGARYGDVLLQALAFVLLDEIQQGLRSQSAKKHGFVLAQHFHAHEAPLAIERDQQIEGRAFKAGNRGQIEGFEHPGHGRAVGLQFGTDRPGGKVGRLFAHM